MVPIRLVSEELGAKVDWDNNTSSAIISSGSLNQSNNFEELKFYIEIMNHYNNLVNYGRTIWDINTDNIVSDAANHGIDFSNMMIVLKKYLKAIDIQNEMYYQVTIIIIRI